MIVFIDFDGVTHPQPCFAENAFCRLPLIEEVLREFARTKVVISSSWRDYHPLDEMREFFSSDLRDRVIGVTPSIKSPSPSWLPGQIPEFEREWEIESWMKEHRRWGERWLAIDDRPYWFRPDCADLLVTNAQTGFCAAEQATLRLMFKERL